MTYLKNLLSKKFSLDKSTEQIFCSSGFYGLKKSTKFAVLSPNLQNFQLLLLLNSILNFSLIWQKISIILYSWAWNSRTDIAIAKTSDWLAGTLPVRQQWLSIFFSFNDLTFMLDIFLRLTSIFLLDRQADPLYVDEDLNKSEL